MIIRFFIVPNNCGGLIPRSTPHVLHVAPFLSFACFFTITMNSRDNPCVVQPDMHNLTDCQCIYQLPLPRLRHNHACGTEVEFVSFSLDKIFGHHHIYAVQLRSCR